MTWRPSDLDWSRYLADELGWWQRRRFESALRSDEMLRQERDQLLAERAAFRADSARAAEVDALAERLVGRESLPTEKRPWLYGLIALPAVAAAAGVVLFFVFAPAEDTLTAKGQDLFVLHARSDQDIAPLGPVCRPGEALRAQYRTDKKYLLVLGQDASGAVQALYPMNGTRSQKLSQGEGLTPGSWVLDDALGEERFVAFFSDEPISVADMQKLLDRSDAGWPDMPGVTVVEHRCRKVSP